MPGAVQAHQTAHQHTCLRRGVWTRQVVLTKLSEATPVVPSDTHLVVLVPCPPESSPPFSCELSGPQHMPPGLSTLLSGQHGHEGRPRGSVGLCHPYCCSRCLPSLQPDEADAATHCPRGGHRGPQNPENVGSRQVRPECQARGSSLSPGSRSHSPSSSPQSVCPEPRVGTRREGRQDTSPGDTTGQQRCGGRETHAKCSFLFFFLRPAAASDHKTSKH